MPSSYLSNFLLQKSALLILTYTSKINQKIWLDLHNDPLEKSYLRYENLYVTIFHTFFSCALLVRQKKIMEDCSVEEWRIISNPTCISGKMKYFGEIKLEK